MAYDPEARETSNNAMIIGVVALVLVVLGALAYYATRPNEPTTVVAPITTERVIEKTTEVPAPAAPSTTVIVPGNPAPAPAAPPTSTSSKTEVTVNAPPATAPAPAPRGDTNVTVNTPPATKAPATAPAGDATTGSTDNKTGY